MEQNDPKGQPEPLPRTEDDFGGTDGGPLHDPEAAESHAERSPLKRPRARQVTGGTRGSIHWIPLAVATLAAMALLWALLNGEDLEKYHSQTARSMEKFLNRPVHLENPTMDIVRGGKEDGDAETVKEDPCSMMEFAEDVLPFECLGADRQKSKAFFDACNEIVAEQGWSFTQLQACGLMQKGY